MQSWHGACLLNVVKCTTSSHSSFHCTVQQYVCTDRLHRKLLWETMYLFVNRRRVLCVEEQVKLLSQCHISLVFLYFPFIFSAFGSLSNISLSASAPGWCQWPPLPPLLIVRHSFHGQVAEGETVYQPRNPQEVWIGDETVVKQHNSWNILYSDTLWKVGE